MPERCAWAGRDLLYIAYHDHEWGVPQRDTVASVRDAGARRRPGRPELDHDPAKTRKLLARVHGSIRRGRPLHDGANRATDADPGIVRNRLKIAAPSAMPGCSWICGRDRRRRAWFWQFTGGAPKQQRLEDDARGAGQHRRSDAMSKALRKRGFTFVGSTICYAFMQATGMVNDHLVSCFRHKQIRRKHLHV